MAIPFDDGSRGATSMDRADGSSCRPATRRHRTSVFGRPVALAVDETVPVAHRSRRYRAAHPPQALQERIGVIASTTLAIVSLVFVSVVALASMLTSAAILHLVYPNRRVDDFSALHEPLVLGVPFGIAVFWLLPLHPWALQPVQSEPKKRRLIRAKAAV